MNPRILAALLLGVLALPARADDKSDAVAIVKSALDAWQVPGAAVVIVRGDEVVLLDGFGIREIGKPEPVSADTTFAIASCSKAFTATAIAALIDDGKMSWDDPVRKHLPAFRLADPLADGKVSIRDLLCHRTGLARNDALWVETPWGREELIRRTAFLKPAASFRSAYQYNNLMYLAAGEASASAAGSKWEELVRSKLLAPLGMTSTGFGVIDAKKAADLAVPHKKAKDGKPTPLAWPNLDNIAPAGTMVSTARDLTNWLRFQLGDGRFNGKRLVSAANFHETHSPQIVVRLEGAEKELNPATLQKSYALGWSVQDYHGRLMISHTGGLEGFRSRVVLFPKERLGIALLTNSGTGTSAASMHLAATNTIVDKLLGLPSRDWNSLYREHARKAEADAEADAERWKAKRVSGTKPSHDLDAYAGRFTEPAYGEVVIEEKDGQLSLRWGGKQAMLEPFHFDTFTARGGRLDGEVAVFRLAADGTVAWLRFLGQEYSRSGAK